MFFPRVFDAADSSTKAIARVKKTVEILKLQRVAFDVRFVKFEEKARVANEEATEFCETSNLWAAAMKIADWSAPSRRSTLTDEQKSLNLRRKTTISAEFEYETLEKWTKESFKMRNRRTLPPKSRKNSKSFASNFKRAPK